MTYDVNVAIQMVRDGAREQLHDYVLDMLLDSSTWYGAPRLSEELAKVCANWSQNEEEHLVNELRHIFDSYANKSLGGHVKGLTYEFNRAIEMIERGDLDVLYDYLTECAEDAGYPNPKALVDKTVLVLRDNSDLALGELASALHNLYELPMAWNTEYHNRKSTITPEVKSLRAKYKAMVPNDSLDDWNLRQQFNDIRHTIVDHIETLIDMGDDPAYQSPLQRILREVQMTSSPKELLNVIYRNGLQEDLFDDGMYEATAMLNRLVEEGLP